MSKKWLSSLITALVVFSCVSLSAVGCTNIRLQNRGGVQVFDLSLIDESKDIQQSPLASEATIIPTV